MKQSFFFKYFKNVIIGRKQQQFVYLPKNHMSSDLLKTLVRLSDEYKETCVEHISIDCVVFGFYDNTLKILLIQPKEQTLWALPGGYLKNNEDMDHAAMRVLKERTGAEEIFLKQFHTFGKQNRSEYYFDEYPDDLWHKQRFACTAYYALIDYRMVDPKVDVTSQACQWHDVDKVPDLIMDHSEIFQKALKQLRKDLNSKPIGLNLLPEKFTMPELKKLYDAILGKELHRTNFYRKILRYGILIKLPEVRLGLAHRSPALYSFNIETYEKALLEGFNNEW